MGHQRSEQAPSRFCAYRGGLVMDALIQTYGRADSLYSMYKKLSEKFNMPVYTTLGNHEIYGWQRNEPGIESHPEFGKKMFEKRLGKRFYSFDHKGWHFIVLDAIYLGERGAVSGKWWSNNPDSKPEEGFVMIHLDGENLEWEYVDLGWTPPGYN